MIDIVGGVEAMACGISRSLVSQYGDRNSDSYPPALYPVYSEYRAVRPVPFGQLVNGAVPLACGSGGAADVVALLQADTQCFQDFEETLIKLKWL